VTNDEKIFGGGIIHQTGENIYYCESKITIR